MVILSTVFQDTAYLVVDDVMLAEKLLSSGLFPL